MDAKDLRARATEDLIEIAGSLIDYAKITDHAGLADRLSAAWIKKKVALYNKAGIDVVPGGIPFQLAVIQHKVDDYLKAVRDLGFQTAAWVRHPRQLDGIEVFHGNDRLPAFLGRSEIVVNLLPLTPETEDILGAKNFALMPKGAAVINLGRGQHVVDANLIAALDSGQLVAATLDVFRQEPLPKEHPFWRDPRVTVIPHASRGQFPAEITPMICGHIRRLQRGEKLTNRVDVKAGY